MKVNMCMYMYMNEREYERVCEHVRVDVQMDESIREGE